MSIGLTDELEVKTKKGKLAAAKQVFLEGDQENLQQIGEKTRQLENAVKDITATGGASTANAVSYSNETSGMTAITAQGAIDELAAKNKTQDSSISTKAEKADVQASVSELKAKNTLQDAEIAKKANSTDVASQMQTEQSRVNGELDKKFNKKNIAQELGEDETKVASLKCVNVAIDETNKKIDSFNSFSISARNKVVEIDENNHIVSSIDNEDVSHEYLSKRFHKDLTVEGEIKGKTMTSFESNISENKKEISQEVEKRENLITDSNHPKYAEVTIDKDNKIIDAIKEDGTRQFNTDVEFGKHIKQSDLFEQYDSNHPKYAEVTIDKDNKIIDAIKEDGTRYFHSIESPSLDSIIKMINAIDFKEKTFTESADLHLSYTNKGNNIRYYQKSFECNFENGKRYVIVRKETFGCISQLFPEASSAWNQYVKEFDINKNLNIYDIFIYDCKEDNANYLSFRGYTDADINNEYWIFKESNKSLYSLLIMLAEIQSKVEDGKLPSYYDEYVQDKTKKIVDTIGRNGYGSSAFFFMSDYHWGANALSSGALLGQLVNETGIKRIILGGDIPGIGTYDIQSKADSDTYSLLQTIVHNEQLSRMNTEYIYQSRGNHDIWNKNFNVQEDYTGGYNLLGSSALIREPKDFIHNSEDSTRNSTYGYFDDVEAKIRYIIFDTSSIADYGQYGVTLEQLQWIYNNAIKENINHYDIIAVGHIELSLIQGSSAYGTKSLQDFLYALSDKTKVTISNQEFDFTESTEKLIAYFHGHEHNDLIVGNRFMQIGICCDACADSVKYRLLGKIGWINVPLRNKGTVSEQCIDAVIISTDHKKIYSRRIGFLYDRNVNIEVREVSVGSKLTLNSIFTSPSWHIFDSDVTADFYLNSEKDDIVVPNTHATITTDGIVNGISQGYATALAINNQKEQEFFIIKVI